MARTLAIVGAGRVGRVLGARLREQGWTIGAVVTRHAPTARAAVRAIGSGTPCAWLSRRILSADLVLVTTPDGELAATAEALARIGGEEWSGKTVLHTSGALPAAVLGPLAACGVRTASMHPMQTFGRRGIPRLEGAIFALEGGPAAVRVARGIVRSLGGVAVRIEARDKAVYHCSAGFAASQMLASIEAGTQMLLACGFSRKLAVRALLPLARQTLANFEYLGPRASWAGPLSRSDYATVRKHLEALGRFPAEFRAAYVAMARLTLRLLADSPRSALAELDRNLAACLKGRVRAGPRVAPGRAAPSRRARFSSRRFSTR